jgi:hypothetical protein
MRKGILFSLISLFGGFIFTQCDNSGNGLRLISLEEYQNAGAGVAEKKWTVNYDCSNFSTQFYQNCYKAGLPCRVRSGKSGGPGFSVEDHAWNSVKIDGTWVNWEPQLNAVYTGHTQTATPLDGDSWGDFLMEDIVRIVYETAGRYVPSHIIDSYEIDAHWNRNSPFYPYYTPYAYCLSNDPGSNAQALVATLQTEIPNNNDGDMFITGDKHLFFFFKYNNKYYGLVNLETQDPVEGRIITQRNILKEIIDSGAVFAKLDLSFSYGGRPD